MAVAPRVYHAWLPLAVFWEPPLTDASSPPAVFWLPPVTDANPPLAMLFEPPRRVPRIPKQPATMKRMGGTGIEPVALAL